MAIYDQTIKVFADVGGVGDFAVFYALYIYIYTL